MDASLGKHGKGKISNFRTLRDWINFDAGERLGIDGSESRLEKRYGFNILWYAYAAGEESCYCALGDESIPKQQKVGNPTAR